ncbi:MAG: EAL domain-containing protein, partial [Sulfurimonas sp.]|nr:EAL domain-containing protein [Sulfurimonas sp.]
ISMGVGLGMNVIAEGVETIAQQKFLKANGCLSYQGYLFSKPLPIEELEDLIIKKV